MKRRNAMYKNIDFFKKMKERYEKYWSALQGNLSSRIKSLDNEVQMAGWNASEMLSGINSVVNLSILSGQSLASCSDIVTKLLVGLTEMLFKKDSVNCWKAKLIIISMLISSQVQEQLNVLERFRDQRSEQLSNNLLHECPTY